MTFIPVVTLAILDGVPDQSGHIFDAQTNFIINPAGVPIRMSVGQSLIAIGSARRYFSIYRPNHPDKVLVDLAFSATAPASWISTYPTLTGKILARTGNHIDSCEVLSVDLSSFCSDLRIPKLDTYVPIAPMTLPLGQPLTVEDLYVPNLPGIANSNECKCERLLIGHDSDCGWVKSRRP